MTELIEQRTPHDCVTCSLAMLMGVTYERVVDIGQRFSTAGWTPGEVMHNGLLWSIAQQLGHPVLSGRFLMTDRPALVIVPSMTDPSWFHAIYFDGKRVFDPAPAAKTDLGRMMETFVEAAHKIEDYAALVLERVQIESARGVRAWAPE